MNTDKKHVSIHDVRRLLPGELTQLGDFFDMAGPEAPLPDFDPLLECEVGIVVPLNELNSNKYYRWL
jgi:hypothetical protein